MPASIVIDRWFGLASACFLIGFLILLGVAWLFVDLFQNLGKLRRRYSRTDCCQHCNYNLTGNLSGVCPECGALLAGRIKDP